tara:strand:+ start:275 stop:514 length:240 start_codon:yes stop_codon:yes gene_type:complete
LAHATKFCSLSKQQFFFLQLWLIALQATSCPALKYVQTWQLAQILFCPAEQGLVSYSCSAHSTHRLQTVSKLPEHSLLG